jgi:hypothetical protein
VQDNDVIIDWGDGTIEAIKDGKYTWKSGKQYDLSHDYASSMTEDVQTFIVKIYGKDYYTFRNNSFPNNNLISRIFDVDLPIASHIGNFASMCLGATRLTNVTIPHSTKYVTTAFNFSSFNIDKGTPKYSNIFLYKSKLVPLSIIIAKSL